MIVLCLAYGCRTKHKTLLVEKENTNKKGSELVTDNNIIYTGNNTEELQRQIKEFREFLSNLNIDYQGKEMNDKLEILLNKSKEGNKLIIQGKGNVNYSESVRIELENVKKEMLKHQDSVFNMVLLRLSDIEMNVNKKSEVKEKEVNERGFEFGFWIVFLIVVVVVVILKAVFKR